MDWKAFFNRNKHILLILYCPVYLYCFQWLEARDDVSFVDIHCVVDDWIPFCEIFVIPYLLWFLYVFAIVFFLCFQRSHLEDFYHCAFMLMLGMSTCLLFYYIFPNAQSLRPDEFARSNIFTDIVRVIYTSDTNTNVLPSIHVYNSIAVHSAFANCYTFKEKRGWRNASLVLCILICLSTMFLKQHSFLDVIAGFGLYGVYSGLVYKIFPDWQAKVKKTAPSLVRIMK